MKYLEINFIQLATLSGRDEVVLVEMENRVHVDHLPSLMAVSGSTVAVRQSADR